jgi:hypothetical protein
VRVVPRDQFRSLAPVFTDPGFRAITGRSNSGNESDSLIVEII